MRRLAFALLFGLACLGGRAFAADPAPPELRVLAAASMTEVVNALATSFPDAKVVASFGSSADLARQLADEAPGDVFISASPEWIDFLREKHALSGEAVVFAGNALVAIAPAGSDLGKHGAKDAASLVKLLKPDDRVAIADAGVPAGEYARQSLAKLNLLSFYTPRLVGQKDVRAVLHAVETGEVKAGFVYATDARVAKVESLFVIPADTHEPIQYLAAVVKQTKSPQAAARFLAFLKGPVARETLTKAGFTLP